MKMTGRILILLMTITFSFIGESCKNKDKTDTTQTTNTDAPVTVNSDADLRTSVDSVVKEYEGVQADVNDGVVTLRGTVKQDDLQELIQKVQELRPRKVENQLVVK